MGSPLDFALVLAGQGFSVYPAHANKIKDAAAYPAVIVDLWRQYPGCGKTWAFPGSEGPKPIGLPPETTSLSF